MHLPEDGTQQLAEGREQSDRAELRLKQPAPLLMSSYNKRMCRHCRRVDNTEEKIPQEMAAWGHLRVSAPGWRGRTEGGSLGLALGTQPENPDVVPHDGPHICPGGGW